MTQHWELINIRAKQASAEKTTAYLENECTQAFRHGNFCNTLLRKLWWAYEVCVQEQKCGFAPSLILAVKWKHNTQKIKKKRL